MSNDVQIQKFDEGASVSLRSLVSIYYPDAARLGSFRSVPDDEVPLPYRALLAHACHMTVTVEAFHQDAVDVQVLQSTRTPKNYCREILLKTHAEGQVVQYGIVRLNFNVLAEGPRREIMEEQKPLGRVLIERQVLREIELFDLWEVHCGEILAQLFNVVPGTLTYGRTALIHCDGEPAIELLEIVTPV